MRSATCRSQRWVQSSFAASGCDAGGGRGALLGFEPASAGPVPRPPGPGGEDGGPDFEGGLKPSGSGSLLSKGSFSSSFFLTASTAPAAGRGPSRADEFSPAPTTAGA